MPIEIEKKYRLTKSQRRAIEQRMREMSLAPGELEHEENTIYRGGMLERPGCALRLRRVNGRAILEASGGVTLSTVRAVAETGVDWISIGALTHSAPSMDLALDFE